MMKRVIFTLILIIVGVGSSQADEAVLIEDAAPLVYAVFMGYQQDDLIFQIVNKHDTTITIKGLSYNGQILYRPLNRKPLVKPESADAPFTQILFRAPSDFVWSQNHMDKFKLVYILAGQKERNYALLYNGLLEEEFSAKSPSQEN